MGRHLGMELTHSQMTLYSGKMIYLDGYGDNYGYTNITITVNSSHGGQSIDVINRVQYGDAFPDDSTQWSDVDGDGFGDQHGYEPDAFPQLPSQNQDLDRDGYGDNGTKDAFEPDDCKSKQYLYIDRIGCLDRFDGVSDQGDSCPFDPDASEFERHVPSLILL